MFRPRYRSVAFEEEMKENSSLLKILSVTPPLHDASDGFNCPNYEKGKKLEIAQITAFSCLSAAAASWLAKIQRIIAAEHVVQFNQCSPCLKLHRLLLSFNSLHHTLNADHQRCYRKAIDMEMTPLTWTQRGRDGNELKWSLLSGGWWLGGRGQEILTPDPASPPPLPVLDPVLPPPSTAAVFRLLRSVEGRRLGDRYQMVSAPNCRAAGLGSSTTTTMNPDTGSYKLQWSLQCSKGWNQGRRISAVGRLF